MITPFNDGHGHLHFSLSFSHSCYSSLFSDSYTQSCSLSCVYGFFFLALSKMSYICLLDYYLSILESRRAGTLPIISKPNPAPDT